MKILLAHGYFLAEDEVEQKVMKPYPPLGLLYVSGYLKNRHIEHRVFDSTFRTPEDLKGEIINYRPDHIGFYVNFLTRKNVLNLIDFIKETGELKNTKIILGGPDVRFYAEDYLGHGADYIVVGEGEVSFFELIVALRDGQEIKGIQGIAYKNPDGGVVFNEDRLHQKDLSDLPWPNRDAIDLEPYLKCWNEYHGYSSITISTQRGCPFSCAWCSHAVFGDTYRRRPVGSVVEELEVLRKKYNPDSFWFVDDVFTMSEKWISEFAETLKSKRMEISFECITRADRLNEEIISNLKASGCNLLWIGAESGSQKVLDLMDRRVDARQVRDMIRLARKYNIKTGTFIMLGYPGEEMDDIYQTIDHLKEAGPDFFTINMAYPIKGTKMHNLVKKTIHRNFSWADTPDRDLDFKRKYSRRFYQFAIRKVLNEVYAERERRGGAFSRYLKHRIKSLAAGAAMHILK